MDNLWRRPMNERSLEEIPIFAHKDEILSLGIFPDHLVGERQTIL
jgi:hypothetical protein